MPTEMRHVKVGRIALLPRKRGRFPANKRRVLLVKAKGADMADKDKGKDEDVLHIEDVADPALWAKAIKAALAEDGLGEHEKAVDAVLAKADVSKEDATAIKGALRMLRNAKSVPGNLIKQLSALVNAGFPFMEKKPDGEEDDDKKKPAFLKSAHSPLLKSDGTVDDAAIDAIEDTERRAAVKAASNQEAKIVALTKRAETQDKLLKAAIDKDRRRDHVEKAGKEMPNLPGTTPEKTGALLLKCEDGLADFPGAYDELVGIFKASSANAHQDGPRGTSARGAGEVTVEAFTKAAVAHAKSMGRDATEHAAMEAYTDTEEGQRMAEQMAKQEQS